MLPKPASVRDVASYSSAPSLPQPPFVSVAGIPNFRTIGAHNVVTPDSPSGTAAPPPSKQTRSNFVFRCGDPSQCASAGGASALRSLGITTLYDLRSAREAGGTPYSIEGVTRIFAPVYEDADASPAELAKRMANYAEEGSAGFIRAYEEILQLGRDAYRILFRHVLERPGDAFVAYCTGGKDRTGVFVALALSLAGVPDEEVAAEYSLSELGLAQWMDAYVAKVVESGVWGGDEKVVRRALGARKEVMLEFLEMLRGKWGGADGYLRKWLGFEEEEIRGIRANLVEEIKAQIAR